jgi:hypothetical protein
MKVDSCFELNKWILRLSVEQISLDQDFNEVSKTPSITLSLTHCTVLHCTVLYCTVLY